MDIKLINYVKDHIGLFLETNDKDGADSGIYGTLIRLMWGAWLYHILVREKEQVTKWQIAKQK